MNGIWLVSYIALWVLFLVVAIVLVSTLRNLGVVYSMVSSSKPFQTDNSRVTNLTRGEEVPDLTLSTVDGLRRSISEFRGSKIGFVIVSPSCSGCAYFLESMAQEGPDPLDEGLRDYVIISVGDAEGTLALLGRSGVPSTVQLLLDQEGEVDNKWGIHTTPCSVVVDEGMAVKRLSFGTEALPLEAARGEGR